MDRCAVAARMYFRRTTLLSLVAFAFASVDSLGGEINFNSRIRPILSQHCLRCHGPDASNRESEFRVDSRSFATADLGGHAGIVPGEPDRSEAIRRIVSEDPDEQMPPPDAGQRLTGDEVTTLRQWIAEGAKFATHWAYRPIELPAIPEVANASQTASDIDRFVLAELQRAGLELSPPVDKAALIRRATFDLTGLPPTWIEVQSFVNDHAEDAFAKVIDRLLDSDRYGERWGRHWLDIARYADTHGGGAIGFKRFAFSYTYRDYVIQAFNNDLPYDRFVLEQIAADQLGLDDHDAGLAGLGFLTVGRQYPNVHDLVDDRIDVVTRGLLGMTVACARCHDHKYDAISTSDYYSLYATFACSETPQDLPTLNTPADSDAFGNYRAELASRTLRRDEMVREQSEVLRNRLRMQVGVYLRELAKGTPEQDLATIFLSYRTDDYRPIVLERWRKYLAKLTVDDAVFGVWHRLNQLPPDGFTKSTADVVAQLAKENGDTSGLNLSLLATPPPRWNPRVLDAIRMKSPSSMLEVADAYGELFATVQEEWLQGLLAASLEARAETKVVPDESESHATINSSINRQLRFHLYAADSPISISDDVAADLLNRPINDHVSGLGGAIHDLHLNSPGSPPRAMLLRENPNPPAMHVFLRGNPLDRGPIAEARFLEVLSRDSREPFADGRRRLGLARAIIDPANPLTRRVIVNWVWQRHFGRGLVRTPDDFGVRGDAPTHPELLDFLAETFLTNDGWSIKKLHRRIMLSQVYQQASRENVAARLKDPENRLLWRMPRRRLELEAMRDAMLAVAGRLDPTMGGRPFDLFAEPFTPRRSVYGFVNRDVVAGFFSTFDMADPSVCAAKRPETTVPQQALFALNSKFIQEQAKYLSQLDEIVSATTDQQRIEAIYRRAFSRMPSAAEMNDAMRYVESQSHVESQSADPGTDIWQSLAHVLLAANEFNFLD